MKRAIITALLCCLFIGAFSACRDGETSSLVSDNSTVSSVYEETSLEESSFETVESSSEIEESSSEIPKETYSIEYIGIKVYQKQQIDIPDGMMPAERSYPVSYAVGEPVAIDDLKYLWTTQEEYVFKGYYTDPACEEAFEGITETTRGKVTVYALIQVNYNTPNV